MEEIFNKYKKRLQTLAGISQTPHITKLYVFDFDGTLVKTPLPEEGIPKWEEFYRKEYPYQGWWGRPESLDVKVFDNLLLVNETINRYNQVTKEDNAMVILLTARVIKLESYIKNILHKNNLRFDKYLFRSKDNKPQRIEEILKEYPTINYVEIWDDRDKEIELFNEWKETKNTKIVINQVKSKQSDI